MNRVSKKLSSGLLTLALALPLSAQTELYISTSGSDQNPGTKAEPFRTLEKARDAVRALNDEMSEDITVYLRGGTYYRQGTFELTDADSGSNGHSVVYRSYPNESAVISGGTPLSGWQHHEGEIYKTVLTEKHVNAANNFHELYVDGKRAYRARSEGVIRANGWHHDAEGKIDGYVISGDHIGAYKNAGDVQLSWSMNWRNHRLPVASIESNGSGAFNVIMKQPYLHQALIEDFPGARPNANKHFHIENAYELLDAEGEWYYDRPARTLYYWPKEGQSMSTAKAFIPRVETLLTLRGSSKEQKIENVKFQGLSFMHTVWEKPFTEGATAIQANHYNVQPPLVDIPNNGTGSHTDNAELPRGAIELEYTSGITFEGNTIAHTGGTGIILYNAALKTQIRKNTIQDISETAIIIGSWIHNFIDEDHEELCRDILIRNNLIERTGQQYWGAPAIQMYYADGMTIEHNDILKSNYGGIQFGWNGWQGTERDSTSNRNTVIRYNRFQDFTLKTGDSGSIYSLGQQPNTEIYQNYFKDAHKYQAAQYNDEGSAYVYWHENVVDQKEAVKGYHLYSAWRDTIHDNWCDMTYTNYEPIQNNGIRCHVTNVQLQKDGWSREAQAIIDNAGRTDKPYVPARQIVPGDVAYGKNAVIYSKSGTVDHGEVGHLAQFAVDGNPKTSAMAKDVVDWVLEVDLIEVFSINKAAVVFAENQHVSSYTLLASRDGVDWTEVAKQNGGKSGTNRHAFRKMDARFVRVVSGAGSNKMGISSIHVQGELAAPRPMSAPYAFTPPQADHLKLWVKADAGVVTAGEGFVSEWQDQSGNGNHMVLPQPYTKLDPISSGTSVSTKKPVLWTDMKNGRPAVRFDGFDDCLVADGVSGSFANNTVIILFRPHASSDYSQVFTAKGQWGEFMFHAGNNGSAYVGTSVNSRFDPKETTGSVNPGEWELFSFTLNDGTAKLFNNAQLVGTKPMDAPADWTGFMFSQNVDFREKNRLIGSEATVDGDVAEVLVYNSALSDSELQSVHKYLADKYGL